MCVYVCMCVCVWISIRGGTSDAKVFPGNTCDDVIKDLTNLDRRTGLDKAATRRLGTELKVGSRITLNRWSGFGLVLLTDVMSCIG